MRNVLGAATRFPRPSFITLLIFTSVFIGFLAGSAVFWHLHAEEVPDPILQIQFMDDRPIMRPDEGYTATVNALDVALDPDDPRICLVHDASVPGNPERDELGWGKILVTRDGSITWMSIAEFYEFALGVCTAAQQQLLMTS